MLNASSVLPVILISTVNIAGRSSSNLLNLTDINEIMFKMNNIRIFLLVIISLLIYSIYLTRNNSQLDLRRFVAAPVIRNIFTDGDGNAVPLFDENTLYPKPGGGFCKMTNITDKEQYFQGVENLEVTCKDLVPFDGYWGCMDGFNRKDNCIVLGFGVNFGFNYEDSVIDKYGCQAYSFDPTMGVEDYVRKDGKSKFFNLGVSSFKGVKKITFENRKDISAKMDHFVNIVNMLGLENSEIDFLKVDIEGSELDFILDTASSNPEVFGKIRQIQIELHSLEKFPIWHSGNRVDTTQFDMMKILDILHCHGFALAHSELWKGGGKNSKVKDTLFIYNGKERGPCYITTWVRV